MRILNKTPWLAAFLALALPAVRASAQTVTCTISATPMAFGNYNPLSPARLGPVTSSITARCSVPPGNPVNNGFTMSVALSTGSSGSYALRRMTSTPAMDTVQYNIYTSAAATTIWGDGTGGTSTVPLFIPKITPGQAGNGTVLGYGFVPALQDVAAANYADTISIIATW